MRAADRERLTIIHPYAWAWEPLESDATFVCRAMFGTKAAYVGGKLVLCFAAGDDPWHGVLVCTDRVHHESLRAELASLRPHPVLPKWLYLPDAAPQFESAAARLVELVRRRDPRIGVEPHVRERRKKPHARRPKVR